MLRQNSKLQELALMFLTGTGSILVWFLLLWSTPGPKATWRGKDLFHLQLDSLSSGKLRLELEAETRGMLLPGLLPLTWSATFLKHSRSTCLGMAQSTVDWTFLHQVSVRRMLRRHDHRPVCFEQFFSWGSFFPVDCRFLLRLQLRLWPTDCWESDFFFFFSWTQS